MEHCAVSDSSFKMTDAYINGGDRYVGETVDGKREGYGAYYYTNGNYYYGQYRNNLRHGYGAMFRTENRITLQYWEDNKVDGAFN